MTRSRPRKTATLSESVHRQLSLYALGATAAGVGVLALAQPAEAKIVYTPAHRTIANDGRYDLDLNHDGVSDFVLANPFRSLNSSFAGTSSVLAHRPKGSPNRVYGRGSLASCLREGVRVGPGGRFSTLDRVMAKFYWADGSYRVKGNWANAGKGVQSRYLGFRFEINKHTHYGWARLNLVITDTYPGMSATLTGYAYETIPNKAIITGKTHGPDDGNREAPNASLTAPTSKPSTLGMLALGAPALSIWRRQELVGAKR